MVFNSFGFAIFLPVVFLLYWAVPAGWQWAVLLAANYVFYGFCGIEYIGLILAMTVLAYAAGYLLEKETKRRKTYLRVSMIALLLPLFYYKYCNFFLNSTADLLSLFGGHWDPFVIQVLMPVGISFYTFTLIAYLVDVYRGRIPAQRHFGKFAAFISFFPSLLSGPIERAENLLEQIREPRVFSSGLASFGLREMLWGFFKKMVVADSLAGYVNSVFGNMEAYSGFQLVLASVFYTVQIYCDFSGYSDIAIGTAKLFGIRLKANFRLPYKACSIKEFWSRWHISLSSWFRDYLYIPLGGNRVGFLRHKVNLMVTFLVSGLWHGANWNFILWGGIHGGVQVLETFVKKKHGQKRNFLRWAVTMMIVSTAWIFFRAETVQDAMYLLMHCLDGIGQPKDYILNAVFGVAGTKFDAVLLYIPVILLVLAEWICTDQDVPAWMGAMPLPLRWAGYLLLVLLILFLTPVASSSSFLYFQF